MALRASPASPLATVTWAGTCWTLSLKQQPRWGRSSRCPRIGASSSPDEPVTRPQGRPLACSEGLGSVAIGILAALSAAAQEAGWTLPGGRHWEQHGHGTERGMPGAGTGTEGRRTVAKAPGRCSPLSSRRPGKRRARPRGLRAGGLNPPWAGGGISLRWWPAAEVTATWTH